MRSVNISTLRAQLSRLLAAVRRGQTVQILDRDVPIAQLVPVPQEPAGGDDAATIDRLRRSGAQIGTLRSVPEILNELPPGPAKTGALDALLEERGRGR